MAFSFLVSGQTYPIFVILTLHFIIHDSQMLSSYFFIRLRRPFLRSYRLHCPAERMVTQHCIFVIGFLFFYFFQKNACKIMRHPL